MRWQLLIENVFNMLLISKMLVKMSSVFFMKNESDFLLIIIAHKRRKNLILIIRPNLAAFATSAKGLFVCVIIFSFPFLTKELILVFSL